MLESLFRVISIGIVAENKPLSSHEISVIPIEIVPIIDGDLVDTITSFTTSGIDNADRKYTVEINASLAIKATWLPLGSNRITSPDVRRGEKVKIWQFADVDKYYWTSMGFHDELRRLETVLFGWSATKDEGAVLDPAKNMYTVEVSTHNKEITIRTTKANGEPYAYVIQLNTKDGNFFISDDIGNAVELNSSKNKIRAVNSDRTEVTLDKKNLRLYAKDSILAKTDGDATLEAGKNIIIKAGKDITATSAGGKILLTNGSAKLVLDGPNVDTN